MKKKQSTRRTCFWWNAPFIRSFIEEKWCIPDRDDEHNHKHTCHKQQQNTTRKCNSMQTNSFVYENFNLNYKKKILAQHLPVLAVEHRNGLASRMRMQLIVNQKYGFNDDNGDGDDDREMDDRENGDVTVDSNNVDCRCLNFALVLLAIEQCTRFRCIVLEIDI